MERRAEPQPSGLGILPTAAAGLHTNVHTYIHTYIHTYTRDTDLAPSLHRVRREIRYFLSNEWGMGIVMEGIPSHIVVIVPKAAVGDGYIRPEPVSIATFFSSSPAT